MTDREENMPDHYWISHRETLPSASVKQGHRWPCCFDHSRDYAHKYTRTSLVRAREAELLRVIKDLAIGLEIWTDSKNIYTLLKHADIIKAAKEVGE